MAHSPLNQEIDFLISFINGASNGETKYLTILKPIFQEAKSLANGEIDPYQLTNTSVSLKVLLKRYASEWLLKADLDNLNSIQLADLKSVLDKNRFVSA